MIHFNRNGLHELDGFGELHLSKLKLIDISNNSFDCNYLSNFRESCKLLKAANKGSGEAVNIVGLGCHN